MVDNPKQLRDLLQQCTVRMITNEGDKSRGTGFFVAPGLILTCTHVLPQEGSQDSTSVSFIWKNEKYWAQVKYAFPSSYPDIALLQVADDFPVHPCVYLHEEIILGDHLYCFGYPPLYLQGDPSTFIYEDMTGGPQRFLKFKGGEAREGFSGGPLLNGRTGCVCGIMKLTRGAESLMGGRGVPTRTIFAYFPELVDQQIAFHLQDSIWSDAFTEEQRQLVHKNSIDPPVPVINAEAYYSTDQHSPGQVEIVSKLLKPTPRLEQALFFRAGGPVSPDEACYISRICDRQVLQLITADCYVGILAPRQVGKTSLLNKTQEKLNDRGIPCAFVDLSQLRNYVTNTLNQQQIAAIWYNRLATSIHEELKESSAEIYRNATVYDSHTFIAFLNRMKVIAAPGSRVVIMLDEAAAVPASLLTDFFAHLRTLFNSRHTFRASPATRISFVFAGAFNHLALIKDPTISPFNITNNIEIPDLNRSEVDQLLRGFTLHQITLEIEAANEIWNATQGHPYLTQKICQNLELAAFPIISTENVKKEIQNILHSDSHLQNLIRQLNASPQEAALVQKVLSGQKHPAIANQTGVQLEMLGILKMGEDGYLCLRNTIYENLFREYFANHRES